MIEIINGECIEELRKLDSSTVDLIITDPPYNIANFMNGEIQIYKKWVLIFLVLLVGMI